MCSSASEWSAIGQLVLKYYDALVARNNQGSQRGVGCT